MIQRPGQAMLEYVLAVAILLGVVSAMGFLVSVAFRSANRANVLVRTDFP